MKKIVLLIFCAALCNNTFAQTNTFPSSGNVGIGTTSPSSLLHVYTNDQSGHIRIGGGNGSANGRIFIHANMVTNNSYIDAFGDNIYKKLSIDASPLLFNNSSLGKVGIGTESPFSKLHVKDDIYTGTIAFGNDLYPGLLYSSAQSGEFRIDNRASFIGYISFYPNGQNTNVGSEAMRINSIGNVGIGSTIPDEKLTVKGKIHAEEVRVDLSVPGPDYVFNEDYKLTPLSEIQTYIKTNKHLPEVPSAKEMKKDGINLSEMNMLLLKKVRS